MLSKARLLNFLHSCPTSKSLTQIHAHLLRAGILPSASFFVAKLIASYSTLDDARKLFEENPRPSTRLWNAVLRAHARGQQWRRTLLLFHRMHLAHHRPDCFTLHIALKACVSISDLDVGEAIHCLAVKNPSAHLDMFVGAALVEMYSKFGEMRDARKVFDEFREPDVVLWTSMVTGYQQNGLAKEAVLFFSKMVVRNGVVPDPVTLISVISALEKLGDIRAGKSCHGYFIRMDLGFKLALANAILNFYANLGAVEAAKKLFDVMPERDVITWSCMIACHAQNGDAIHALNVYRRMTDTGLEPNLVTAVSVLQACALVLDLEEGRRVHELAIRKGFELDLGVSTALMDMYMKCSCCDKAVDVFHQMPKKDVVSWAVLISGFAQNGLATEALGLFRRMLDEGTIPDAVTMVKVVAACSQAGNLSQALCLHGYLVRCGFSNNAYVRCSLIDLYAKCGILADAVKVFESTYKKDLVLWCSMIAGYGMHGLGGKAISLFEQMVEYWIKPNSVTFVSVLSACSHAGMVDEGQMIFESMSSVYSVVPNSEHYGIMVDMLARTGKLKEALRLIEGAEVPVGPHVWCALLSGCRTHQNTEMGELVARKLLEMQPDHAGYHKLLSNMYAADGKWDRVGEVESKMKKKGLRRRSGHSSVEIDSETDSYCHEAKVCF